MRHIRNTHIYVEEVADRHDNVHAGSIHFNITALSLTLSPVYYYFICMRFNIYKAISVCVCELLYSIYFSGKSTQDYRQHSTAYSQHPSHSCVTQTAVVAVAVVVLGLTARVLISIECVQ